tara:strand:+ start:235 stop:720 length:486 start_codon:yes stop_codon:yes gene_type:complete
MIIKILFIIFLLPLTHIIINNLFNVFKLQYLFISFILFEVIILFFFSYIEINNIYLFSSYFLFSFFYFFCYLACYVWLSAGVTISILLKIYFLKNSTKLEIYDEFYNLNKKNFFLLDRINKLISLKIIANKNNEMQLTNIGRFLSFFSYYFKSILSIKKAG